MTILLSSSDSVVPSGSLATAWKVTNIVVAVADVEQSHTFTEGTKSFTVYARDANMKVTDISGNLATNYRTIEKYASWSESGLNLPSGFTIYFSCDKITVLEVVEWI